MDDIEFIKFLCQMIWKIYCGSLLNAENWSQIKHELLDRDIDPDDIFTQQEKIKW